MKRKVRVLVHDRLHLWELSSVLAVLRHAEAARPGSYCWELVGTRGGLMTANNGIRVEVGRATPDPADTLVINGCPQFLSDQPAEVVDLARRLAGVSRRVVALCIGNFMAARAGLLDGVPATVHWKHVEAFRRQFPDVRLVPGRLYLDQGPVWSCAGDTSALHLTLALVEADFGPSLAAQVARDMLIYTRRDGMSPQISTLLTTGASSDRMRRVVGFARENLRRPLTVEHLAEVAALSPRQFARVFKEETGMTPARFVERLRVEEAQPMIENTRMSLATVAREVGFACEDRMREAFMRVLGQPPSALRTGQATVKTAA